MHRFFVTGDCFSQDAVAIPRHLAHRLRDVLRLSTGDRITVLDNTGWEYEVELRSVRRDGAEGRVVGRSQSAGEPSCRVTLFQALLKGGGFESVLQKCTEVGASAFVPLVCDRCVAERPGDSRIDRWRKVILEAAQQSRRGKLPVLHPVADFSEVCRSMAHDSVLLWEGEESRGFKDALSDLAAEGFPRQIGILIGPEGGFTDQEVDTACSCGIVSVGMGPRILRAETAGPVAVAVALYELGELGSGTRGRSG